MTQNIKTTINRISNPITTNGNNTCGIVNSNPISYYYKPLEKTFYCLGEEIKVSDIVVSADLSTHLSLITVIGIQLYAELKKNGVSFPSQISDILDIKYKAWLRSSKIDSILED